jgi:hypothetical protein
MPELVAIPGCGPMVCSTYEEMMAAVDRIYGVAEDQPLPFGDAFAAPAARARPAPAIAPPGDLSEPPGA